MDNRAVGMADTKVGNRDHAQAPMASPEHDYQKLQPLPFNDIISVTKRDCLVALANPASKRARPKGQPSMNNGQALRR